MNQTDDVVLAEGGPDPELWAAVKPVTDKLAEIIQTTEQARKFARDFPHLPVYVDEAAEVVRLNMFSDMEAQILIPIVDGKVKWDDLRIE